jgi:hypothetical protein
MSENRMLLVRADQLSMTIHRGEVVSSSTFRRLRFSLVDSECDCSPPKLACRRRGATVCCGIVLTNRG